MSDLMQQLSDYAGHFDRALTGRPAEAIAEPITASQPDREDVIVINIQSPQADLDEERDAPRRRWLPYAVLAAAAVIVVVIMAVAFFGSGDESSQVDVVDTPDDGASPDPSDSGGSESAFTARHASALVDDYFNALNAGDLDGALALFTPGATFSDRDTPTQVRPDWEPRLAWDLAKDETSDVFACAGDSESRDELEGLEAVSVLCEFTVQDAIARALGQSTPYTAIITVTREGILDLREDYQEPDRGDMGSLFSDWVAANHPDVLEATGCCEGATIDESIARGELVVQYAEEWAAYLDANGCTFSLNELPSGTESEITCTTGE